MADGDRLMGDPEKKIIDYTVVTAINTMHLAETVHSAMSEDWQPFGGVCLAYERNIHRELGPSDKNLPNDFEHYAQAMVKYEMFPGSSELTGGKI